MEVLRNKRYLGLAGIVLLFLGVFFPYYIWSFWGITGKISLIGYWEGYVVLVSAVACGLFIFKDYVEKYIPNAFNSGLLGKIKTANPKLVIIPVIIAALVAIYLTVSVDVDRSIIKYGLGFWITWLGVALLIAHVFLYKGETGIIGTSNNVNETVPQPAQTFEMNPEPTVTQQQPIEQQTEQLNTNNTDQTNNNQF